MPRFFQVDVASRVKQREKIIWHGLELEILLNPAWPHYQEGKEKEKHCEVQVFVSIFFAAKILLSTGECGLLFWTDS